jgi:uncharacterized membrane protein YdcZ (DUF606 family)
MQGERDPTSRSVSRTGERQENVRRGNMPDWVWVVGFVAFYIVMTQWLLPKLGVPT